MVELADILRYLPKQHGEHGVDATLHMLARKQNSIHEVFRNPPGGSWTHFDIIRPTTGEVYRWDHMPRLPEAKRPDWVLQFNENRTVNFLLIESKPSFSDVYDNMGKLLIQFFSGSRNFLGLRNRPAWHRKQRAQDEWTFITPKDDQTTRFWLKQYDDNQLKFWSGFAFALDPEYYQDTGDLDKAAILSRMGTLLGSRNDLEVIIGVGWTGEFHTPFVIRDYSENFRRTKFASELDKLLAPALLR
jgi:hypothetical protein